jgi:Phosphotransferase enzyme family
VTEAGETREPLLHNEGNAATDGIWRVRDANGGGRILRVAKHGQAPTGSAWRTSDVPTHFNYWRREVLAYETGFADAAYRDAGIRAPRLESLVTREDGCVELWLEDVAGPSGFKFSIPRLGQFGHELGVGQARWAGRVPSADEVPWLSRGWLRQYLSEGPGNNVRIRDEDWDDPVARVWSAATRAGLRRLWERRMLALEQAERLPRTLCHLDLWPANLLEDSAGTSVLLDWAFVGEGALGEDPANLIIDSVTDGLMDAALLPEIAEAVTEGYVEGLADGGWRGSADDVRRAIATCGVVKYSWLGAHAISTAIRGRARKAAYDQDSPVDSLKRITGLAELLGDWADVLD